MLNPDLFKMVEHFWVDPTAHHQHQIDPNIVIQTSKNPTLTKYYHTNPENVSDSERLNGWSIRNVESMGENCTYNHQAKNIPRSTGRCYVIRGETGLMDEKRPSYFKFDLFTVCTRLKLFLNIGWILASTWLLILPWVGETNGAKLNTVCLFETFPKLCVKRTCNWVSEKRSSWVTNYKTVWNVGYYMIGVFLCTPPT